MDSASERGAAETSPPLTSHQRAMLADADVAAGRLIPAEQVKAWIDSLGTAHELPPPRAPR